MDSIGQDLDLIGQEIEPQNEFSPGQPAQFLPHTRAKCKPLLVYNNNLYADTNVKIGKNGTHYFKCVEYAKTLMPKKYKILIVRM